MVQWLSLHAPSAEGPGSIPGQGTISHMPQVRPNVAKINTNFLNSILSSCTLFPYTSENLEAMIRKEHHQRVQPLPH